MGMELGIDKKQIEAIKAAFERWTSDRVQLRFLICLALATVGLFGVINPLSGRMAKARSASEKANKLLKQAEELAFWTQQIQAFEPRVAVEPDIIEWQSYVLEKLSHTSAQLIALEPRSTSSRSVFKIIQMEVVAKGKSYEEFVDFIDRLEHGERIVRIEGVRVEKQQDNISLTCTIMGLVKPSALKSGRSKSSGELQDAAADPATEHALADPPPQTGDSAQVAADQAPAPDSGQSPAAPGADEDAENEARPGNGHDRTQATEPDRDDADGSSR